MKIKSKSYGEELEIVQIGITKELTLTVEVFKVPEGYKSFATNSYIQHDALVGGGTHENKQESVKLAIDALRLLMADFEQKDN